MKTTSLFRTLLSVSVLSVAALLLPTSAEAGGPTTVNGNGNLSITFSDDGAGGTAITASGTGLTDDDLDNNNAFLGFLNDGVDTDSRAGVVPPGLLGLPAFSNVILTDTLEFDWTGPQASVTYGRISSNSGPFTGFILQGFDGVNVTSTETMSVIDGTGAFALPYSTFASVYGQSFASTDGFTFIFAQALTPAAAAAAGGSSNPSEPTILVTNIGAIMSATTSGLNSIQNTLNTVQNAAQNAVGDLNNRIFNARSGGTQGGNDNGVASTLDGTSRYLNFAQNQGIDYRVALGLAEGKDVEIVDTLSGGGHPFAMAGIPGMTKTVVVAVEGGKSPVGDKVVIEEATQTQFEVFTSFDYGYYDQDNLTRTFRGFEVDSYAGSAGLEVRLTDWLVAGTAFTYLESDTRSTVNLGGNELDGQVYSVYATAFHGNTYLDVLYSYGDFDNDISRNTLLGSTAYGDTESHSHNIDLNLGHTIHLTEKFSFGPSAGLNYTTGEVDGYTERNGGLANLIYPDHDFESMIGRLGGYATYKCDTAAGLLTNQFSAGWAHEFEPDSGAVTTSLQTSPFALVTGNNAQSIGGFTASEERAHAGTDWLELGVSSRLDIKNTGFNVQLGYQGMFGRNNASGHFGSAKIGYEW